MENCLDCSTIGACPFSYTEESEQVQNYGCLPTPYEIITMRVDYGKTWACHSNTSKPCLGALNDLKELELPYKVIDSNLITEDSGWNLIINPKSQLLNYLSMRKFMLNKEKYDKDTF